MQLTESRLRKIIREVIDSSINGYQEPEREYADLTGERFDEILRQNGITAEDLVFELPDVSVGEIFEYFSNDKYPDKDNIRDSWEEKVYTDKRFENFVHSLTGMTQQDIEAMEGYADVWYCESELVKQAFEVLYKEAYEEAEKDWDKAVRYNDDPLSYYGLSPYDFY